MSDQQLPPPGYGAPASPAQQHYPGYPGYPPPSPPKPPWYHSSLVLALSLLFCWPVGLPLIWTSKATGLGTKIAATVIFGGLGLFFLIGMGAAGRAGKTSSTYEAPTRLEASPTPVQERTAEPAAAVPVSESCVELATKFGVESKLSDLQKEELWKNYAGKSFAWSLKITEVSSGLLGGFTVQAKCAPRSPSFVQDIVISYDSDAKSFVMGLEKDQTYTLKGVLSRSSTLLGLSANGVL